MATARPQLLRIGQLAKKAGVSVQTIRFYEREGLLAPPSRTLSGYRAYTASDLERVRVIRVCQKVGFTLKDVKVVLEPHEVLASCSGASSARSAAREKMLIFARQRLLQIEEKLAALTQQRADMAALVATLAEDAVMVCPASRARQESDDSDH
ncbi:MAG TPA: MerR family transcriptional regulator [Steroidobacteraceae bacterium]|nr:MerR family transcriptional regulator [Steroidobacteraceae bacterium]